MTGDAGHGTLKADRAIRDRKQEEMRHPLSVWADPSYADQDLHELREAYLSYLRGRAKPVSASTVTKYNKTLLSFIASLKSYGDPLTLAMVTPANANRWVKDRRERGLSEEWTATHLIALKVFTNKYVFKELELTKLDLLRKVPRMTPPEKPAQVLSEEEREQLLSCFDSPSYEDVRNKAFVATYMATGLRFKEVLELTLDQVDRFRGAITVTTKGGKTRPAMLSPRALKLLREYLKIRPASDSDRLWLIAEGAPLAYMGGQEVFRKLKKRSGIRRLKAHLLRHGFAQAALSKGAHPGMVQEMLGHATPAMTRRYLGWAKQEEAAKQMPAYSPI